MSENPNAERSEGLLCACCAGQASGIGYATHGHNAKPIWVCTDPTCLDLAQSTYLLRQHQFNAYEALALGDARDEGAQYLMGLNITDLALMDEAQVAEFFRVVVAGYRAGIKRRLTQGEAPF